MDNCLACDLVMINDGESLVAVLLTIQRVALEVQINVYVVVIKYLRQIVFRGILWQSTRAVLKPIQIYI